MSSLFKHSYSWRISCNSEDNASESPESLYDMIPHYYMDSDWDKLLVFNNWLKSPQLVDVSSILEQTKKSLISRYSRNSEADASEISRTK